MTQNEKDRETVNQALGVCRIALAQGVNEDAPMIQAIRIADKLLKERENAEVVYKQIDPNSMINIGFWTKEEIQECVPMIPTNVFNFKKGVWIADGEAE